MVTNNPVEKELAGLSPSKDMLLTIGVFDGVHLGHKYLLSQLKERAHQEDCLSGVITFRRHPQAVLSPQTRLPCLTDLMQRKKLLKDEGIDTIVTLSFTREMAQLSPHQFVGLLKKYLGMCGLVIGPDFALGQNREGDADALRALGKDIGFSVTVVPPVLINGEVVSSTAIRNALAEGDVKKVNNLIGRPFSLHGRVVAGAGRGRGLGFPTANLDIDSQQALPPDGVYAAWANVDNKAYHSVINIGKRPTFGSNERAVEVYILDYHGELYGRRLKIDIIERLRSEERFDTAEELRKQMAEDVRRGETVLNRGKS